MKKKNHKSKYVVMCVGHTHTGKTTFAKQFLKKQKDFTLLDSDEVAIFLREKYPLVVTSTYNKARYAFEDANLKITVFKDIYLFALKAGMNLMLSNGNLAKNMRSFVAINAKKHGYSLATIYFNLPRELILQRLKKTKKSGNVFIQSKSWDEVLARQEKYAELPPSKKETAYFEIKNDADAKTTLKSLSKLMQNKSV